MNAAVNNQRNNVDKIEGANQAFSGRVRREEKLKFDHNVNSAVRIVSAYFLMPIVPWKRKQRSLVIPLSQFNNILIDPTRLRKS